MLNLIECKIGKKTLNILGASVQGLKIQKAKNKFQNKQGRPREIQLEK